MNKSVLSRLKRFKLNLDENSKGPQSFYTAIQTSPISIIYIVHCHRWFLHVTDEASSLKAETLKLRESFGFTEQCSGCTANWSWEEVSHLQETRSSERRCCVQFNAISSDNKMFPHRYTNKAKGNYKYLNVHSNLACLVQ
jgi:hypothetical protein